MSQTLPCLGGTGLTGSCVADCRRTDASACSAGTRCDSSSGACVTVRCDDPSSLGCVTGMVCDPSHDPGTEAPGRYDLFGTDQYPNESTPRGMVPLTQAQQLAASAGCVFLRCDESGSFDCAEGFECDVASADATSSGCLPLSCEELDRCTTPAFTCERTSDNPRPAGEDVFGCVRKNCEEGHVCGRFDVCDFSAPGDAFGCAPLPCEESGECAGEMLCDPEPEALPSGETPSVDAHGCRAPRCEVGEYTCSSGLVCDGTRPGANVYGCSSAPAPVVGTGGSTGTGGSSSGGANAGGAASVAGAFAAGASTGGSSGASSTGGGTGDIPGPVTMRCQTDSDCQGQYCVNGTCAKELGICR